MKEEFIEYLRSRIGSAYVWGAQGERCTDALIERRETSGENKRRARAFMQKRLAEGAQELLAYDCSGLIAAFLLENGLIKHDLSSRGLFRLCTEIGRAELKSCDLVFRHNGKKIHHVGVYIGDGEVIESKGRDAGVVSASIDAWGKGYWNRYGRLPFFGAAEPRELKLSSPMMQGNDVALMQMQLMSLGYDVGEAGADGRFGRRTESAVRLFKQRASALRPDGICGADMRLALGIALEDGE